MQTMPLMPSPTRKQKILCVFFQKRAIDMQTAVRTPCLPLHQKTGVWTHDRRLSLEPDHTWCDGKRYYYNCKNTGCIVGLEYHMYNVRDRIYEQLNRPLRFNVSAKNATRYASAGPRTPSGKCNLHAHKCCKFAW